MADRSERDELADAWRALRGLPDGPGWRTIAVCTGGPCRFLAGRQTPGDEEALLIDVGAANLPSATTLPQGRGFVVSQVKIDSVPTSVWLAVSRRPGGGLDLFAAMAEDIVRTLHRLGDSAHASTVRVLLDRIRAWQMFMDRGGDGVLSAEGEIGLVGELVVLLGLLEAGVSGLSACEGWDGPRDGVHDFRWRSGAIEVKASTAPSGSFPARIGSIEQLDDAAVHPLFLAAVRLNQAQSGRLLADWVTDVRQRLVGQVAALDTFNDRVLQGGYSDAHADRYTRRFTVHDVRLFPVDPAFPRLTRSTVPAAIVEARYQLDLDAIATAPVTLDVALSQIGVL